MLILRCLFDNQTGIYLKLLWSTVFNKRKKLLKSKPNLVLSTDRILRSNEKVDLDQIKNHTILYPHTLSTYNSNLITIPC